MTSLTRSAVVALAVVGLSSCVTEDGNGRIVTEQRTVREFLNVKAEDGLRVEISRGPRSVSLTTDENLRSFFRADVRGDTLVLKKMDNTFINPTGEVLFEVSNPVLQELEVSDGAHVSAVATAGSQMRLTVSEGGVVSVTDLATQRLELEARSRATIDLSGVASDLKAKVTGKSQVRASGLSTINADVDVSDGSTLDVSVSNSTRGDVSGDSQVNVAGNPQSRFIETHGRGQVTYTDGNL